MLHQVHAAAKFSGLLAFRHDRADSSGSVEGGYSRAGRAHALGKCTLRHQLEFHFAREHHLFEQLVFSDVGPDVLANLAGSQQ